MQSAAHVTVMLPDEVLAAGGGSLSLGEFVRAGGIYVAESAAVSMESVAALEAKVRAREEEAARMQRRVKALGDECEQVRQANTGHKLDKTKMGEQLERHARDLQALADEKEGKLRELRDELEETRRQVQSKTDELALAQARLSVFDETRRLLAGAEAKLASVGEENARLKQECENKNRQLASVSAELRELKAAHEGQVAVRVQSQSKQRPLLVRSPYPDRASMSVVTTPSPPTRAAGPGRLIIRPAGPAGAPRPSPG